MWDARQRSRRAFVSFEESPILEEKGGFFSASARFKTRSERRRTFRFFERRNPLPVIVSVVPPSFGPAAGAIALSTGGAASGEGGGSRQSSRAK